MPKPHQPTRHIKTTAVFSPIVRQTWWIDSLFLLFTLGGLFFILLSNRPLFVPDEGRYAEIAREMVVSGNYVTPYLDGIKYFEKPVLFYWLCTAAIKFAGLSLWSLRSVNACLALLCCWLTYFTCRKLYQRQTALLAAFILGTCSLYFVMAHMVSLDLAVTCFLTASLYFFMLGCEQSISYRRRYFLWAAFACAALAVLTKGLIGILFPVMIVGAWIVLTGQWRLLTSLYLPSSICVFLVIVVPWHYLVMQANPEFFNFYFIQQHFLRYTTTDVGHYQPAWFFLPVLFIGFFPWTMFLPQALIMAIKNSRRGQVAHKEVFLLLWASIIFIFFSFSKSKLIPYILPVFPPLAIISANYLNDLLQHQKHVSRFALLVLALFVALIAYIFYHFSHHFVLPEPKTAANLLNLATCVLLASVFGYWIVRADFKKWLILLISNTSLFLLLILAASPSIDTRTILPLAKVLKPILKPSDEVITFNQYYQDLPFYLERTVSILNWRNELKFGMQHQAKTDWLLNDADFWQRWRSPKQVYIMMGIREYQQLKQNHPTERFYLVSQTITTVLATNHSD